jgi:hypothetical protein
MVDILTDTDDDRRLEAPDDSKPDAPDTPIPAPDKPRTPEPGASLPFDTSATSDPLGILSGDAFKKTSFDLHEEYKKYESQQEDVTVQEKRIREERDAQLKRMMNAEGATAADMHPWNPQEAAARHSHDLWEQFGSPGFVFAMLASSFTGMPMTNALNAGAAAMKAINQGDMEAYHREFDAWKQNTDLTIKRFDMEREAFNQIEHLYKDKLDEWHAQSLANAARFDNKKAQILLENGMYEPLLQAQEQAAKTMEDITKARDQLDLEHSKHEFINHMLADKDGKPLYNLAQHPELVADAKMAADLAFSTPQNALQFEAREMVQGKEWQKGDHEKHVKMIQDLEAKSKLKENLAAIEARDKYAFRAEAMKELGISDPDDPKVIALANKKEANSKRGESLKSLREDTEFNHIRERERANDPTASDDELDKRAETAMSLARKVPNFRSAQGLFYHQLYTRDPKISPEEVERHAALWTQTMALASTSGKREFNVTSAIEETKRLIVNAVEASRALTRSDIVSWNKMTQAAQAETSNPRLKAFFIADQGLKTGYASTMNRSGQTPVHSQEISEKQLQVSEGMQAYETGAHWIEREMYTVIDGIHAAQKSFGLEHPAGTTEPTQTGTTSSGITWSR